MESKIQLNIFTIRVESFKNLTIKPKRDSIESTEFEKKSMIEIFINNITSNLSGWIKGEIKDIRSDFAVVEYTINNQSNSQILPKKLLRNALKNGEKFLELNLNSNNHISYNLDFLNGHNNKIRKIKNFTRQIKNLVSGIKFIFYSISSNDFIIFPDDVFTCQEEKTDALISLDTIMNNIVDFYVRINLIF